MKEQRGYQYGFSTLNPSMHDASGRERKAATMVAVLSDYFDTPLDQIHALDMSASTGIISNYLAQHFSTVTGIDIDSEAIGEAQRQFQRDNLTFIVADALNCEVEPDSVDVVICSQLYEHVPDAFAMMDEVYRVLRPGGICYFAAGNRLMWNEPHYHLPLLSVIPRPLAHLYVRATGRARHYHELHYSYWGLRKLVKRFEVVDYTDKTIHYPERFKTDYMLPPNSRKAAIAKLVVRYAYWLVPGYIWLLRKPDTIAAR